MMILCSSQRVEYQGVNVEGGVMKLSRVAFLWGYSIEDVRVMGVLKATTEIPTWELILYNSKRQY